MTKEDLMKRIKEAMIQKSPEALVLKAVLNTAQMTAKEAKTEVTEAMINEAAQKEIKQTRQAMQICEDNNQTDTEFYQTSKERIRICEELLPRQLTEEEIREAVKKIAAGLDNPNRGQVMKAVMPVLKGQADGKMINKIVAEMF